MFIAVELAIHDLSQQAADSKHRDVRLVLLHGFTLTSDMWKPVVDHLMKRCASRGLAPWHSITGIDLAGHGQSPPLQHPVDFASCAAGVATAIDRSRHRVSDGAHTPMQRGTDRPVVVVGYSMGGRLAWSSAERWCRPGDRLLLIGAHPGDLSAEQRRERKAADNVLAERLDRIELAEWMRWWVRRPIFDGLTRFNDQMGARLGQDGRSLANALRSATVADQPNALEQPGVGQVPTSYLAGLADTTYRRIASALAARGHARSTILPGSHALPLIDPEGTARWIWSTLSRTPPR